MIHLKSPQEIAVMAEGGKILAEILQKLSEAVKPGITTQDLEKLARELILSYKVKPAFLGYSGYPAMLCASVNEEVVHCEPSGRKLKNNDILSLDMGLIYNGFNLDSAVTLPVIENLNHEQWANFNPKLNELIQVTKKALDVGIEKAKAGNYTGDVGYAIQMIAESRGFNVVRDLVGHGIGRNLHEEPQVPNFGKKNEGLKLREGMVLAIEPMVTMGGWRIKKDLRGFTYRTLDGSYSAHFEHTVAITNAGPLILTK